MAILFVSMMQRNKSFIIFQQPHHAVLSSETRVESVLRTGGPGSKMQKVRNGPKMNGSGSDRRGGGFFHRKKKSSSTFWPDQTVTLGIVSVSGMVMAAVGVLLFPSFYQRILHQVGQCDEL